MKEVNKMAFEEDFDDVMEKKNKKICPRCFHEMKDYAKYMGYRSYKPTTKWICLDCGKMI